MLTEYPSLDANLIKRKEMRLAMSAGTNRHYRFDEILPRHFVHTAERAGMGRRTVQRILEAVQAAAPTAVDRVANSLSDDFPEVLTVSIGDAINRTLRLFESATT